MQSQSTTKWQWLQQATNYKTIQSSTTDIAIEFALSSATSWLNIADANIIDKESVPIVKSGKKGADGQDGQDAARLVLTPNILLYLADDSGKAIRNQSFNVTGQLLVNGVSVDVPQSGLSMSVVGSLPADVTNSGAGPSQLQFSIAKDKSPSGSFKLSATGTLNGISYTAVESVLVEANRNGSQGEVGHVGRFYYYAGEYDGTPSHYSMEQTQAPYVKVTDGDTIEFWMLDNQGVEPDGGVMTASQGPKTSGQIEWTQMSSEQQYYIAKAFFGEYAQFGSFIINDDWMLSTNGKISGTSYNNSALFYETSGSGARNSAVAYTLFVPSMLPSGSRSIYSTVTYVTQTSNTNICLLQFDDTATIIKVTGYVDSGVTMYLSISHGDYSHENTITATSSTSVYFLIPSSQAHYQTYLKAKVNRSDYEGTITSVERVGFVPNFAVDGLTGNSYQNSGYFRGNIEASTIKAANFFRNICMYYGGSMCYNGGTFQREIGGVQKTFCTSGNADVVVISQGYLTSWDETGISERNTILLPNPSTVNGKMITVYCEVVAKKSSAQINVGCTGSGNLMVKCASVDSQGRLSPYSMTGNPVAYMQLEHAYYSYGYRLVNSNGDSVWTGSQTDDCELLKRTEVTFFSQGGYWYKI